MTREEYHRSLAVDLLTLILCLPFCMWLGWWGILPAFGIGWGINRWHMWHSRAERKAAALARKEGE